MDRPPTLPLAAPPDHGPPRGHVASPFGPAAPSILFALAYTAGVVAWLVRGDTLPGGRWLAVHLFTLGVLTNLVLTFSEHFSRTLTHAPGERAPWWPYVTNAGILGVLAGVAGEWPWVLAAGAATVTWTVLAAWWRIRRMRHQALGMRFAWVVRTYERAYGAFVHGAVLGVLLGTGALTGTWYGAGRLAHLHANVLGWGGLTLLATLVFFGPSMARARIEPGADARAARALRIGATGLSVAVVGLLLTGIGGTAAIAPRLVAAAGLAALAWAASVTCLPVARAVRGRPTAPSPLVAAACTWLPLVAWADAVVVAAGAWRWLDALGVAVLVAVLAQAILATLVYLAPMLRGRTPGARDAIRRRLEVGMRTRAVALNLGAVAVVTGAARLVGELPLAAAGWATVAVVAAVTATTALVPQAAKRSRSVPSS